MMEKEASHRLTVFFSILISISLAVMIYLSNLHSVAFDKQLYVEEFDKYNISARFDAGTDLADESSFLIDYLSDGEGRIGSSFYNEREVTHLIEVRGLFKRSQQIFNITVLSSVLASIGLAFSVIRSSIHLSDEERRDYLKKMLSRILIMTGSVVNGVTVFFVFVALTFSGSFVRFHQIFFRTDTWMLDPATDNLIRMMPQEFFFDLFVKMMFASVIFATVFLVAGFLIRLGKPRFTR